MKKIFIPFSLVVFALLFIVNSKLSAQAPFGGYLSIGPGSYAANHDFELAPGANTCPNTTFPFTLEFYVKLETIGANYGGMIERGTKLSVVGTNLYAARIISPPMWEYLGGTGIALPSLTQWRHVVMEVYSWGGDYRVSVGVDGDCVKTYDAHSSTFFAAGNQLFIGDNVHYILGGGNTNRCYIDEVRYSTGLRYGLPTDPAYGAYIPPFGEFVNDANTILLLHFNDETFMDSVVQDTSGNNRDFLLVNGAFVTEVAHIYTINGDVSSDTLCSSSQIFAVGGNEFHWTPGFGLSDSNIYNPTITVSDTTLTYYISIIDSNSNLTFYDTITITVPPVLDLGPDTLLCGVSSYLLNIPGSFSNILWQDSSTSPSYLATSSGIYSATVTDVSLCVSSDTIEIHINPLLNLTLPSDTMICPGDSVLIGLGSEWGSVIWQDNSSLLNYSITGSGLYIANAIDTNGCPGVDSISILFNPVLIYGTAYTSDSLILSNTTIFFVQPDTGNLAMLIDSVVTDGSGYFSKEIMVFPINMLAYPDSLTFPMEMPTYYDTVATIQESNFIFPNSCDSMELNLYTISGINPGGPGHIGGYIINGGRVDEPVSNLKLILINTNGDPVWYRITNTNGYFFFSNIPYGTYYVFVDKAGIDNSIAPQITISATTDYTYLYFGLYSDHLELIAESLGNNNENSWEHPFFVYPNPSSEYISLYNMSEVIMKYRIINVSGQIVASAMLMGNEKLIRTDELVTGTYFLELVTESNQTYRARFIKIP